jgi:uncharacterized membrane protein (UPF0127 family)
MAERRSRSLAELKREARAAAGAGPCERPQIWSDLCQVDTRCGRGLRCAGEVHSNEVRLAHNGSLLRILATFVLSAVVTFPHGTAVIRTPARTVQVRIEIAETAKQKERGLSGRRTLASNAGMAFLWRSDVRERFWMKDTSVPLSIAFWDKRGRILRILDMAPCRRDPCKVYDPHVAFRGALEVNRGAFARWGVRRGALVTLRR